LVITVEERLPEVLWQTGDQIWWIDSEGVFVPPREEPSMTQGRLRIIDQDHTAAPSRKQVDVALVHSVQLIHNQLPEVETLYYSQQFGLSYRTAEGWPVYLGESHNMEAKLLVANSVRSDLLTRDVIPTFIDVRNPLRAIYEAEIAESGF
jgi:cell division septal protein FtsQ